MNKLRITEAALIDLESIEDYTARTWGDNQADIYLNGLNKRLHWLTDNPLLGKVRDEIYAGICSYPEASHIIFYQVSDDLVEIVRVLHL